MVYQFDINFSLQNQRSKFISRLFQQPDYLVFSDFNAIQKYVLHKKKSGLINQLLDIQYRSRSNDIKNYHLRLVTFFLKEGISNVSLSLIQNDCDIKPIDIKYGFDTFNQQVQLSLLKFVDQMNLWASFKPQIQHLLSQLQPLDLFNLINTYPAIDNKTISVQNPKFVFQSLNNIGNNLKSLQFSQFQSQVNNELASLQAQFQLLSEKEQFLIQKDYQIQQKELSLKSPTFNPDLKSYPLEQSFTSLSNNCDSDSISVSIDQPLKSQSSSQNPNLQNVPPLNPSSHQPQKHQSPISSPITPTQQKLTSPSHTLSQQNLNSSTPSQQKLNSPEPTPIQQTFNSPSPTSDPNPNSYILTYLSNQLHSYFNNSNKIQKTKITKEVRQLLKQKTIQKNSIIQEYNKLHPDNLTYFKQLQKWFS